MAASDVNDKDARKLAKKMENAGFQFLGKPGQHMRVVAPNGDVVGSLSSSPGTPRWELAKLRTLARNWKVEL